MVSEHTENTTKPGCAGHALSERASEDARARGVLAKADGRAKVRLLDDGLAALTLQQLFPVDVPEEIKSETQRFLSEIVEQVQPRDPLEKMLTQQLAWCHQRIARLSILAYSHHGDWEQGGRIHEAVERAMGSYRRGMLALRQYRAQQQPVNVTQVNQAEQQNIVCAGNVGSKT